jgi:ferric-dicitrate binding protein FerR (iron transport regulator)
MKYGKLIISIIALVTLISFALQLRVVLAQSEVKIITVRGKAQVLKAGEGDWQKAKKNLYLKSGDSVKTSADASVDIAFDNLKHGVVSVRENSHVVIRLVGNEKIELLDGEVFALVRKLPAGSSFEIRTPTAVCGARGTGFGAKGNKKGTTVSSYEDSAYASGKNKDGSKKDEKDIPEGYESFVGLFKSPSAFKKIADMKYAQWDEWRDLFSRLTTSGRRKMERLISDLEKIERQKERIDERITDDRIRVRDESSGAGRGTCCDDVDDYRLED